MAAGGDIVELVHKQSYLGQAVHNVYHFEAVVAGATLSTLATWFETNVVPAVKTIQLADVEHLALDLRNLFDESETHGEILTGTGAVAVGSFELPSFVASQIRFKHLAMTVRPGFKRFAGLSESFITDALLTATMIAEMVTLGNMLLNPATPANPDWAHVVVGRICETPNPVAGAVPSCLKYRLPQTQAEAIVGYPTTHDVYPQPTTQNSRKWYT